MAKSDVLVRMKADTQNYDANIAKARRQLDQFKKDNLSMGGVLKQLSGSLVGAAAGFASITAAVGAATAAISSNIETAKNFEKSMSQLSSLTGKVGEDLNKLKEYAIDLGGSTTLTASQVADAFKMIGSQQPQLLSSSEALKAVTKNAITLAEAAGIDLATAAQTLSTSINQMGGDSANAERYINVLAAASQKGAGDISWLGEAITKSATAAKAVGTDYEELVANLEQLAKAGFDASTAGTALRSIIMNLEKQANQDFKPSIVGLTQAFENLGKANLTITQYQEIAGKMFASQAMALANAAGEAKNMKEEITGTNTAEEQAKTNTDNLDGSLKSLSSAWEALNLHINSSNGLLKSAVDWLKDVVKWADQTFTSAGRAQKKLAELQGGGNGQPTKVDRQISALGGSNFKPQAFNAQMGRYNQDIKVAEYFLNKFNKNHSSVNTVLMEASKRFGQKMNSISDLEAVRDAMVRMRDEYSSRAQQILNLTKGTGDNNTPKPQVTDQKKTKAELDELQKIQKKIADLTKEAYTADDDRISAIQKEIAGLQEQEKKLISIKEMVTGTAKGPDLDKMFPDSSAQNYDTGYAGSAQAKADSARQDFALGGIGNADISSFISMTKSAIDQSDIGSDLFNKLTEQLKDATMFQSVLTQAIAGGASAADLSSVAQEIKAKMLEGDIDETAWQEFLDKINEYIQNADLKLVFDVDTESVTTAVKQQKKETAAMAKEWQAAGTAIQAVGSAMSQIEDPAAKVLGTIAQAVATMALSYAQAAASPAVTGTGWGWIAFAATGVATMLSSIAAIKNATSGFASGGVIPGNSYSGDNMRGMTPDGNVYGLNAGELVLNRAQQGVLAASLDGGVMNGVMLDTVITAEEIRLVLNNNGRRTGRGEYVQTR